MDLNLLIISVIGLVAGAVCLVAVVWFFRKSPRIAKVIHKLPLATTPTAETKPEPSLLDLSGKLREFEEKTA